MSRTDEARAFLEGWDPDEVELPDWVVDELERTPALQAVFDARFAPWDGRALGLAPVSRPKGPSRRLWVTASASVMLAAAGALLMFAPGLWFYADRHEAGIVVADPSTVEESPKVTTIPQVADTGHAPPPVTTRPSPRRGPPPPKAPVQDLSGKIDALKQRVSEAKPRVSGLKDTILDPAVAQRVVVMSSSIQVVERVAFDPGSTEPRPESEGVLDAVAQVMKDNPDVGSVVIEGHSESTGTTGETLARSERRANEVRDALVARGVPPERLVVQAYGETRPIEPGGSPMNARVEFRLASVAAPPAPVPVPVPVEAPASEEYTDWGHHAFQDVDVDPLSTFSIDVDTASYSLVRRKLREGYLPPAASVRVEEFVNAMTYTYPPPEGSPFGVSFEAAPNPFNPRTHLVRVGVQGRRVAVDQRRPVHLTFLVDTSGSMQSDDKLPLAQFALKSMTGELRDGDTVAIVAYAGSAGVVLPPTPMSEKSRVLDALTRLTSGGSTAMGEGIGLAYRLADQTWEADAVNRVIIVSDGDANVGVTDPAMLTEQIRGYARKGITLTVAGFGMGNYKDSRMEALADDGDGNYWYVDSEDEAREVFVDRLTSTLVVIAKDVKIQVDWDPATVEAYRLVGYENRDIADRDFRNDRVDAGEIGAGHQVTALYEVALVEGVSGHLATVAVRNKAPGPDSPAVERSFELTTDVLRPEISETSANFRLAVAAASFAERLRGSPHLHGAGYDAVLALARSVVRPEYPEDQEFIGLVERAAELSGR